MSPESTTSTSATAPAHETVVGRAEGRGRSGSIFRRELLLPALVASLRKLDPRAILPQYHSELAAGLDLAVILPEGQEAAMIDLTTRYLGLELSSPLIPGASPLVERIDTVLRLEDAGAPPSALLSLNICASMVLWVVTVSIGQNATVGMLST